MFDHISIRATKRGTFLCNCIPPSSKHSQSGNRFEKIIFDLSTPTITNWYSVRDLLGRVNTIFSEQCDNDQFDVQSDNGLLCENLITISLPETFFAHLHFLTLGSTQEGAGDIIIIIIVIIWSMANDHRTLGCNSNSSLFSKCPKTLSHCRQWSSLSLTILDQENSHHRTKHLKQCHYHHP